MINIERTSPTSYDSGTVYTSSNDYGALGIMLLPVFIIICALVVAFLKRRTLKASHATSAQKARTLSLILLPALGIVGLLIGLYFYAASRAFFG